MAITFNPSQIPSIGGLNPAGNIPGQGGLYSGFNMPGMQIGLLTSGLNSMPQMLGGMHNFGVQYASMSNLFNMIPDQRSASGTSNMIGIRPGGGFGNVGSSPAVAGSLAPTGQNGGGVNEIVEKQDKIIEIRGEKASLEDKIQSLKDAANEFERRIKEKETVIIGKENNIGLINKDIDQHQYDKKLELSKQTEFAEQRAAAKTRIDNHQYVNHWPWNWAKTDRHAKIRRESHGAINAANASIQKSEKIVHELDVKIKSKEGDRNTLTTEKNTLVQEKKVLQESYNPIKTQLEAMEDQIRKLEFQEEQLAEDVQELKN